MHYFYSKETDGIFWHPATLYFHSKEPKGLSITPLQAIFTQKEPEGQFCRDAGSSARAKRQFELVHVGTFEAVKMWLIICNGSVPRRRPSEGLTNVLEERLDLKTVQTASPT